MKYKNGILIILTLIFFSCQSNVQRNSEITANTHQDPIRKDSLDKLNNLKWLFYAIQHRQIATFQDSAGNMMQFKPVECDVDFTDFSKNEGATHYFFRFSKKGFHFKHLSAVNPNGFTIINNEIYPIYMHVKFNENRDTLKSRYKADDSLFNKYLINYTGNMAPWLKEQATVRGIL